MTKRILSILLAAVLCVMSVMTFVSCDDDPVGPANDSENAGGDKTPADDKGKDDNNNDKEDPKGDGASDEKNEDSRYTNYDLAADYDEKSALTRQSFKLAREVIFCNAAELCELIKAYRL